jgi:hypothetical protein
MARRGRPTLEEMVAREDEQGAQRVAEREAWKGEVIADAKGGASFDDLDWLFEAGFTSREAAMHLTFAARQFELQMTFAHEFEVDRIQGIQLLLCNGGSDVAADGG